MGVVPFVRSSPTRTRRSHARQSPQGTPGSAFAPSVTLQAGPIILRARRDARLRRCRRRSDVTFDVSPGDDPRCHRSERLRQDDDDPDADGHPGPIEGRDHGPRRGPDAVQPARARQARVHAAAVQPVRGPVGTGERRIRGAWTVSVCSTAARPHRRARGSSTCSTRAMSLPATCPAGCSAASSWPARSSTTPRCCSSTSRPPGIDPLLRQAIWDELRRWLFGGPHHGRHHPVPRGGGELRPWSR